MARSEAVTMVGARIAAESLAARRSQYTDEVVELIEAAHRVYRRNKYADATVAEILDDAGLGTRAFYRHFESKDELLLAMLQYEAELFDTDLRAALARTTGALAKLECWIDRHLDVAFQSSRSARSALFERERHRLAHSFPDRTAEIVQRMLGSLQTILEEGTADGTFSTARPAVDARVVNAVVVSLLEPSPRGRRRDDRASVRADILRFCLPAIGVHA